ncbi:homeobox-leucine zipper protein ATHB-12-like [Andrographis paniculata]|uniref:homeobox-leucine zipper protein ATHB-12-like n=1 Tax=Andrographis paniculata TaxID=175694 RepID=UPI0021E8C8EC|nr:homeobox-leucine zipper protein ATHB-12-like [Andrographis paniculata]
MEESQENYKPVVKYEERASKMKKKIKNPRRFSDEQIKSLESIFKLDTKLDPRKKLQIAKDLHLQPRQVAIWFQNKRARWKSRQIEQEYQILRENYHTLHIQFDQLKKEKQSLQIQLEELSGLIKNLDKSDLSEGNGELNTRSNEEMDYKCSYNDFNPTKKIDGEDEDVEVDEEFLRWGEEEEITNLGSPETWCNLSSYSLFPNSPSGISNSNAWES